MFGQREPYPGQFIGNHGECSAISLARKLRQFFSEAKLKIQTWLSHVPFLSLWSTSK